MQHGPAVSSNRARVLVLVPTRELAEQVLQSFIAYGKGLDLRFLAAYGGVSINPQMMKLRKGVDVLVATPGRLLDLNRQNAVQFDQVQTLVLDEADRMLDLGFARELNAVFAALPAQRQTLLFSATFTDDIRAMAATILRSPVNISVSPPNATASKIKQWVVTVDKRNKPDLFMHLVAENKWAHALVFVKTRNGVDYLAAMLDEALRRRHHSRRQAATGAPACAGALQDGRSPDAGGHRCGGARAGYRRPAAGDQRRPADRRARLCASHRPYRPRGRQWRGGVPGVRG